MFTPIHTSLGALLLFQGSTGLLYHNGAILGISGLASGSILRPSRDNVPVIVGLLSSVIPVYLLVPSLIPNYPPAPHSLASVAATFGIGILLGWGTKNGRGCTSGHMLCGLSRLSPRSLIATALFFTSAVLAANFGQGLGGSGIPSCGPNPCYTPIYPSAVELAFMSGSVVLATLTNDFVVPKFFTRSEKSKTLFSYIAGLEFGLGLLISGMADRDKVLGFLGFLTAPYRFDPSLAMIIAFGIGPSLLTYLSKKPGQVNEKGKVETKPTLANQWRIPTATVADIDWRFVAGAVVFGIAWGLRGVCPGPALFRTILQPAWGLPTVGGYIVGNLF